MTASLDASSGPTLILACEEPELYQHPPQARHLASVLQDLASTGSQVLVSTHSPLFVAGECFESVRLVRRDLVSSTSTVSKPSLEEIGARVAEALGNKPAKDSATLSRLYQLLQPQLAEMFFTQRLVLVEGLEDCAYLHAWLALSHRLTAFRKQGVHVVPVGGKSELLRPAVLARHMGIPLFLVFDADGDKIEKDAHRKAHERDNRALLRFVGRSDDTLFPPSTVLGKDHAVWPSDLASAVEADLKATLGAEKYQQVLDQAHARCGHPSDAKKQTMLIGVKLALAHEAGGRSDTLNALCDAILSF